MNKKIYCGPNILKFGLLSYQIFEGENLPFNVKDALQAVPELENLFCEPENLDAFRKKIKTAGTSENVYYTEAVKKIRNLNISRLREHK